jgi:hypothetical protein
LTAANTLLRRPASLDWGEAASFRRAMSSSTRLRVSFMDSTGLRGLLELREHSTITSTRGMFLLGRGEA